MLYSKHSSFAKQNVVHRTGYVHEKLLCMYLHIAMVKTTTSRISRQQREDK